MKLIDLKNRVCPVCSSENNKFVGKPRKQDELFSSLKDVDLSEVNIVQCADCSLLYANPFTHYSKELLEKMYSRENDYFGDLTDKMEQIIHHDNPNRRFKTAEKYAKRPIENYLEIGCGQGFGLQAAQKKGWTVYGQDISPDFAKIIKERTGIDILVEELNEDSYSEGKFDFIYIDSVLEHVLNPREFLSYVVKFLADDGILYITLPNEGSLPNTLLDTFLKLKGSKGTSRLMPFAEPYHPLGFTKKSIKRLAQLTGLSIPKLHCKYTYYYVESYRQHRSLKRKLKKTVFGIMHGMSDALNNGMNMEVVFLKEKIPSRDGN